MKTEKQTSKQQQTHSRRQGCCLLESLTGNERSEFSFNHPMASGSPWKLGGVFCMLSLWEKAQISVLLSREWESEGGGGDLVLNALMQTENTGSLGLSQVSSESFIIPQEPLTRMMFLSHVLISGLEDHLAQRIPCQWSWWGVKNVGSGHI